MDKTNKERLMELAGIQTEMFGKPSPEAYMQAMTKLKVAMIDAGRVGHGVKSIDEVYDDIQQMLDGMRADSERRRETR